MCLGKLRGGRRAFQSRNGRGRPEEQPGRVGAAAQEVRVKLDLDKLERLAKAATPGPWDPGPWDAPMPGGRGQRQLVLTTAPVPHAEYGQTRELIASFSVVFVGAAPDG